MIGILVGVAALIIVVVAVFLIMGRKSGSSADGGKKTGDSNAVIAEANKRLAHNPNDTGALFSLANAYYDQGDWERAYKNFETLADNISAHKTQNIDYYTVFLRFGQAAKKLNLSDQAYRGFSTARSYNQNSFEVNYELGALEFDRKNYEKAVQLLQKARTIEPESPAALRYLGHSLFKLKKPKEAMGFIRKAIDVAPDDKESLYTLGECYLEANQTEQALRIFNHLRADPLMGPSSCLIAGNICLDKRQFEAAIQDFEIGLKHQNIKPETVAELRYRLATTHLKQNDISKAIPYLKQIRSENPSYKDVTSLLNKYSELSANQNLQTFLMSPSADFVALCRKVVMTYYPRSKVKIINISVHKNEWADIFAEIDTVKWSDMVMFRFIRIQGAIGELIVRDFHSHLKEVKAGKGICMTVGSFTEEAKRYTEARLIDLIEKDKLQAILNALEAKTSAKK